MKELEKTKKATSLEGASFVYKVHTTNYKLTTTNRSE